MTRKHFIKSDDQANPRLKEQMGALRGCMLDAAERSDMPARFIAAPAHNQPAMIITDTETGRKTTVGLFAYGALREALSDLFGD